MKHRYPALLFLAAFLGVLSSAHAQDTCYYSTVPTGIDYPVPAGQVCQSGNHYNVNPVASDYAILYFDAKKPGCAAAARDRLEAKLRANLNYANSGGKICDPRRDANGALPTTDPFQAALSGAMATGIFSTAVALLDRGYTVDDTLMRGVRDHMLSLPSPQDPNCGAISLPNVNSCMDDYTVTAAGFGWIAAYEAKLARPTLDAMAWANKAKNEINKALSHWSQYGSVCFYLKGSNPIRCDATRTQVEQNLANVIGADHNQENPGYGFGLMTSVATACEGLRRAGYPCTFTSDQKWIAQQLLIHAQQRTQYDGTALAYKFTPWCRHFPTGNATGCWDPLFGDGYLPTLFPLKRFYDNRGLTPAPLSAVVHNSWGLQPAYQFHQYREPRFTWDRNNFWGPLRKLFYEELAYLVWPAHTPQAFVYWIQPAELAGFGAPGSLTVAGGSTQSGPSYPVQMDWRNVTTNSVWSTVPYQPTPDPNNQDVWYNSVPAPTNPWDTYQIRVKHATGPYFYCDYKGGNTSWWCTTSAATPAWP